MPAFSYLLAQAQGTSVALAAVDKRRGRSAVLTGARPRVDASAIAVPRVLRDGFRRSQVSDQAENRGPSIPASHFGDQYDLLVTGPPPEANNAHLPHLGPGLSGAALFSSPS